MFDAKALLEQLARSASRGANPQDNPNAQSGAGAAPGAGLGGVLGEIQKNMGQISSGGLGGIAGMAGQVLGQAVEGVKEGASRAGAATGAREKLTQVSGHTPEQLAQKARDLVNANPMATGAVLGGLGTVLLGTRTGRDVLEGTAKLGALALIGGLAYKAYQNHQAGKPLIGGGAAEAGAAPAGSGFESAAVSNDGATRIIRAMIAAAAADGRIDEAERARIMSTVGASGISGEARAFLEREIANPASAAAIAAGVSSSEEAAQIYTAARLSIDPDHDAEKSFLADLARRLGLEPRLAAEIDLAARGRA